MAYIEKRITQDGKIRYKAQVKLKGHPIQTATFERITDAKRWVQQVESAIKEGRHFKTSESKKRTLKELVEKYEREILPSKPRAKQENQFSWWKEQLGRYVLADITPALIGEYRDKLLNTPNNFGRKRSQGTVLRYLAAISHAFSVARDEWGWLEQSPMDKVRKPNPSRGRVRFLSEEERKNLLAACKESANPSLYTIVVIALSTGMRKSEILNLKWADIDFKRGRITLHETKNGERRSVPLAGLAMQLLQERYQNHGRNSLIIFPGQMGQKGHKPIDIRSAWETAVKRAKITNFKFHDCRHSAASYLAMNGASLAEISDVLGHKTLAMVKRYAHLSEEHTSNIVEKMNQQIFS